MALTAGPPLPGWTLDKLVRHLVDDLAASVPDDWEDLGLGFEKRGEAEVALCVGRSCLTQALSPQAFFRVVNWPAANAHRVANG